MKNIFALVAMSIVSLMYASQQDEKKLFEKVIKYPPLAAKSNGESVKRTEMSFERVARSKDDQKKREAKSSVVAKGHRRGGIISRPPLISDAADLERAAIIQRMPLQTSGSLGSPRIPGSLKLDSPSVVKKDSKESTGMIPLSDL